MNTTIHTGLWVAYAWLTLAIATEVMATSALKLTDGFTQWQPSVLVVIGYAVSLYALSMTLQTLPVGIAYALWAGLGVVLVALVGAIAYRQMPDAPAVVGMALIIVGVAVIHLFSRTISH